MEKAILTKILKDIDSHFESLSESYNNIESLRVDIEEYLHTLKDEGKIYAYKISDIDTWNDIKGFHIKIKETENSNFKSKFFKEYPEGSFLV